MCGWVHVSFNGRQCFSHFSGHAPPRKLVQNQILKARVGSRLHLYEAPQHGDLWACRPWLAAHCPCHLPHPLPEPLTRPLTEGGGRRVPFPRGLSFDPVRRGAQGWTRLPGGRGRSPLRRVVPGPSCPLLRTEPATARFLSQVCSSGLCGKQLPALVAPSPLPCTALLWVLGRSGHPFCAAPSPRPGVCGWRGVLGLGPAAGLSPAPAPRKVIPSEDAELPRLQT